MVQVRVEDFDSEFVYAWPDDKFQDRLIMMRDVIATYEEDGKYPEFSDHNDDPFHDVMEPLLIG